MTFKYDLCRTQTSLPTDRKMMSAKSKSLSLPPGNFYAIINLNIYITTDTIEVKQYLQQ